MYNNYGKCDCGICPLCRNNLTILDALVVHGYGAAVQLLFGGKEPGTSSALLFEYTEASLIQCHGKPYSHECLFPSHYNKSIQSKFVCFKIQFYYLLLLYYRRVACSKLTAAGKDIYYA